MGEPPEAPGEGADDLTALAHAAVAAEWWRTRRDSLIVSLYLDGAGVRELGRAAGMSHTAILRILRRDLR